MSTSDSWSAKFQHSSPDRHAESLIMRFASDTLTSRFLLVKITSLGNRFELHMSVDHTKTSVEQSFRSRLGTEAEDILSGRFIYANVWRPLKGPNRDWPLALAGTLGVNPDTDFEAADYVRPELLTESYLVYYNKKCQWYYLSDQQPSEALLFRQYDSQGSSKPGVPHVAFFDPDSEDGEPRESIEVNLAVFWSKAEKG
ncbi:hypothetical protein B0T16DRAFT_505420 [Cercophora newfieldiana]|uniref:Uncharacterized protein n=1 Tax=Cercophora newfieldiana TaxID=92897 RepID=A0AA39YHL2_9PEZI|nr:hypothetical protein B0T16DRAFT_505420 [Cercophora newfieldiana]